MSEEEEEGDGVEAGGESDDRGAFLERELLRNSRRYTAVFQRIYFKYEREYELDEPGGEILSNTDLQNYSDGEERERDRGKQLQCRQPSYTASSVEEEEDDELTAILNERVVKVKKEVCWEEEEEKLRQRKMAEQSTQSDTSDDEEENPPRPVHRKRRSRRRKNGCGQVVANKRGGDVSETLYETEYNYEPSHVHSEPEETGCGTPLPQLTRELRRDAYSTPRQPPRNRRQQQRLMTGGIPDRVVTELNKRLGVSFFNQDDPNSGRDNSGGRGESEEFVSGYDSVSDYLSGSGELDFPSPKSSSLVKSDGEQHEFIDIPDRPLLGEGGGMGSSPPPPLPPLLLSPSQFDIQIPVISTTEDFENEPMTTTKLKLVTELPQEDGSPSLNSDMCDFCSCSCGLHQQLPPVTDDRSHDKSCDAHMIPSTTVINNNYTNVTYVTYCAGGVAAPSSHWPSCCSMGQPNSCHTYHHPHPHSPYCHSTHSHPHISTPSQPHHFTRDTYSLVPNSDLATKKRKLDSEVSGEVSDPLSNGTEPLAKKQCF